MNSRLIEKYLGTTTREQVGELTTLFAKLEKVPKLFYALIIEEQTKYQFGFASPSISTLLGYPLQNFSYDGGSPFFYSITPPKHRELVLEQETYYLKKARQPDFDFSKPFILEIDGALTHADQRILAARMIAVMLKFTEARLPKLAINTWQLVDQMSDQDFLAHRMEVESLLRQIHKVYALSNPSKPPASTTSDDAMRLSYPLYDFEEITRQEYRVLKLLADGYSTKEIAERLNITENTTETHRKHLLQKFKASNVAEMIKKATKLFWLE